MCASSSLLINTYFSLKFFSVVNNSYIFGINYDNIRLFDSKIRDIQKISFLFLILNFFKNFNFSGSKLIIIQQNISHTV